MRGIRLKPVWLLTKNDGDMELVLEGGSRILFSRSEDLRKALENLQALLSENVLGVPKEQLSLSLDYIDLRFGNKIFYKCVD